MFDKMSERSLTSAQCSSIKHQLHEINILPHIKIRFFSANTEIKITFVNDVEKSRWELNNSRIKMYLLRKGVKNGKIEQ